MIYGADIQHYNKFHYLADTLIIRMKRTLYVILLLMSCVIDTEGQSYAELYGGAGGANVQLNDVAGRSVLGYQVRVGVGRQIGNLFASTGLGYMLTGRNVTYNFWTYDPERPGKHDMQHARKTERYEHVMVPLSIGYGIWLSSKLTLIPSLGVAASYNVRVRVRQTDKINMANVYHITLFNLGHTYEGSGMRPFQKFSMWGQAQADLTYSLNSRVGIVAGISFYRMLTNMIDPTGYPQHSFPKRMYNHTLLFNAGLRVSLASNNAARRYPLSSCGRW